MSKNLSANTLFHFTRSLDNIISILENNFYPRLCLEDFKYFFPENYINMYAIPMVCFCDIPLSQITNHSENYGYYAIGLSKDWGKRNKINPVMYTLPESYPTNKIKGVLEKVYYKLDVLDAINEKCNSECNKKINELSNEVNDFIQYLKPYEGKVINRDTMQEKEVRFYDEREWRYIPEISSSEDFPNEWLIEEEYKDIQKRDEYQEKLKNLCQLKFEPNDIKYIIVKNDKEALEIEKKITEIKGDKYTYNQLRLLKTKIITIEQIESDF